MILWKYEHVSGLKQLRRDVTAVVRSHLVHLPVVGALRLLPNGGVFLVSDQPVKLRVGSQTQPPPAVDGDVAAASVEVTQDHHVLGDQNKAEEEAPLSELSHECALILKQEMVV